MAYRRLVARVSGAREQLENDQLERLQLRIDKLEALVRGCPFIGGSIVRGVPIATTATQVEHRLGRAPKGVVILRATPPQAVSFSATAATNPTLFANLNANSLATVADLYFF